MTMRLQNAYKSLFYNRIFLHTEEVTRVGFMALSLATIDAGLRAQYAHTCASQ